MHDRGREHRGHGHSHGHAHKTVGSVVAGIISWLVPRGHSHSHAEIPPWLLKLGIALTLTTFGLGILFWQLSESVAVLGDALHSLFHSALYTIALWSNRHGDLRRKARDELIMGAIIIVIGIYIGVAGTMSIRSPAETVSWYMIIIACIALVSEIVQAKLMYSVTQQGEHIHKIHMIKILLRDVGVDILASLGVLAGGVVILTYQFYRADGIAAIPIALVALVLGIITILEARDELKPNEHDAQYNDHERYPI